MSVASQTPTTERESPGIVTVITRDEIINSGARELLDVLELVPGIHVSFDNYGVVALSIRGIWSQEGKVLMLWDGQEINERLYGNVSYVNHFPVEHIQRIEIIRGPGSVVYGSFAELAVINVITRNADEIDGARATVRYGQAMHGLGNRDVSLEIGHAFAKDFKVSFAAFFGQGQQSDRSYSDFGLPSSAGPPPTPSSPAQTVSLAGHSARDPRWVDIGVQYKKLDVRVIWDGYSMMMQDFTGYALPKAIPQVFTGLYTEATYPIQVTKRLTLTPRLTYKTQNPWALNDQSQPDYYFDNSIAHYQASLLGAATLRPDLTLLVGGDAYTDRGHVNGPDAPPFVYNPPFPNGSRDFSFHGAAGYAEATYKNPVIGNLTVGARYEYLSTHGLDASGQSFGYEG